MPDPQIPTRNAPPRAEPLARYLTDRRDKRRITFAVLGAYLLAALFAAFGGAFGLMPGKAALDSLGS